MNPVSTKVITKKHLSEAFFVASLLAIVGGFLDAYTYLYRGRVFANGQTGNLVLLGILIADSNWKQAIYYLFPIFSFIIGILLAEVICFFVKNNGPIKWRHVILIIEIMILTIIIFIPQGDPYDSIVNISISFVCALQTQTFRSVRGKSYFSVMCTGNLRSGTTDLFQFFKTKERTYWKNFLDYYLIVFYFIIGALIGGITITKFGSISLLCTIILLFVVLLILFFKKPIIRFCDKHQLTWLD